MSVEIDNFVEIFGIFNYKKYIFYVDVSKITIIREYIPSYNTPTILSYSVYLDGEWIDDISIEDIKKINNMRKSINRNEKINQIVG